MIAGLFGHNEKLKKDFEVAAGRDDAMDFEDSQVYEMQTGTDSDTSQKEGEAGEPDIGEAGEGDSDAETGVETGEGDSNPEAGVETSEGDSNAETSLEICRRRY